MGGRDTPTTTFLLTARRDSPTYAGTNTRKQDFSVRNTVQCLCLVELPVLWLYNLVRCFPITLAAGLGRKDTSPPRPHHHLQAHRDMAPPAPRLFLASPCPPQQLCTSSLTVTRSSHHQNDHIRDAPDGTPATGPSGIPFPSLLFPSRCCCLLSRVLVCVSPRGISSRFSFSFFLSSSSSFLTHRAHTW